MKLGFSSLLLAGYLSSSAYAGCLELDAVVELLDSNLNKDEIEERVKELCEGGIDRFRLINAETNQVVVESLVDGGVYHLADLGSDHLSVEVVAVDSDLVGHITITSGTSSDAWFKVQEEAVWPFASFGNSFDGTEPDFFGRLFRPFTSYSFDATAYGRDRETELGQQALSFTIIDDLDVNGCTANILLEEISDACRCEAMDEMKAFMNVNTEEAVMDKLEVICGAAWDTVDTSNWRVINGDLNDLYMERFFEGFTDMNTGTGNLEQDQVRNYVTTAAVRAIAASVGSFYEDGVEDTILESVGHLANCKNQAIMCCWGRDRQSNDNNGNCDPDDCDDASPADNTNFCAFEDEGEGDTHCHGLAWSNNPNDFSARLKFNNLFYVSLYDHWYTRGYVMNHIDNLEADFGIPDFDMCTCVEELPPVSRSDCTEMEVEMNFAISFEDDKTIVARAGTIDNIDFNACRGPRFLRNGNKSNDLSAYINKLVDYGQMDNAIRMDTFENVLVGYENPDDNQNEAACLDHIKVRLGVKQEFEIWDPETNTAVKRFTGSTTLSLSQELGGGDRFNLEAFVPYVDRVRRVKFQATNGVNTVGRNENEFPYFLFGNREEYADIRNGPIVAAGETWTVTAQATDYDSNRNLGDDITVTIRIVA